MARIIFPASFTKTFTFEKTISPIFFACGQRYTGNSITKNEFSFVFNIFFNTHAVMSVTKKPKKYNKNNTIPFELNIPKN